MEDADGAFFLDTSTQISKTWEDEKIKNHINKELSKKSCYSSEYVKNEYKLKLLKEAILVHRVIVDSSDLDQAQSRLDDIMKRMNRKPDELPYKVFRRYFNQYKSKKPFLTTLEKIIESAWQNFFIGNIKKNLFNLIGCKAAEDDPCKNKGNYYLPIDRKCSDCKINEFLESQKNALTTLSKINDTKYDRINDPKGTLQKIKSASISVLEGKSPLGKLCKEMSDAVISLEAKACCPEIILHSMDSDFKLVGEILGIPTCVHSKHKILKDLKS